MLANLLITIFLSTNVGLAESPLETLIIDRALECTNIRETSWEREAPPREYLLRLLRIEAEYNVPIKIKGLLLAMSCNESGFSPEAEGDHRFDPSGQPKAIGAFQQWPWMKHDRTDPYASAHAQMKHWTRQLKKTNRHCGFRGEETLWAIAQVRSVRRSPNHCIARKLRDRGHTGSRTSLYRQKELLSPRERAVCERCHERSRHWKRFKRWRREWKHLLP